MRSPLKRYFRISTGAFIAIAACAQWIPVETSNTKASLRGVHNAGKGVIWASGSHGTILRSEDDGFVWQKCSVPPTGENLDFRSVWAWDANHAMAMSSGPGDASRLYETVDGCATWRLILQNPDATGFWDGLAFAGRAGMLVGDPVDGRFTVFKTNDLGKHWTRDLSPQLAAEPKRDGIFAASNSSLTMEPRVGFVSGGLGGPRLLRLNMLSLQFSSVSRELTHWSSVALPLAQSESAGAFSVAFRTPEVGIAIGGDYKKPDEREGAAASTLDGGLHWTAASVLPSGFRSAVAWESKFRCWMAVGPNGSDVSFDDGKTWRAFDSGNWNALSLPWAVGPQGRIARLDENALAALAAREKH